MATFEVEGSDGNTYEIESDDHAENLDMFHQALTSSAMDDATDNVINAGQTVQHYTRPIQQFMSAVGSVAPKVMAFANPNPIEGINTLLHGTANDAMNNASNAIGEGVADFAGQHGVPPVVGGGLGMAANVLSNPQTYLGGAVSKALGGAGTIGGATTDANTGVSMLPSANSSTAAGVESLLAKSPTGAPVMDAFYGKQAAQIGALQDAMQSALGTNQPAFLTGTQVRVAALQEQAVNKATSEALYSQVPKDARLPTPLLAQTVNQLADELPSNITKMVRKYTDIGNPAPETTGTSETAASASPSAQPTISGTTDLQSLMTLRSNLTAMQSEGGLNGMYATRIKQALNNDITGLADNANSPLAQMLGQNVKDTLNRATNYYRDMATLNNHPVAQAIRQAPVEDIPDIAFKSGRVDDVRVAKAVLGDSGFAPVQKSFFTDLLNSKNIGKELDKYSPEFLQEALTPQQLQSLQLLHGIKQKALAASTMAPMNGSSRMNAWLAAMSGATSAGGLAMSGHPGLALGALGTTGAGLALPYLAAKLYTGGLPVSAGLASTVPASILAGQATQPTDTGSR